MTKSRAAPLGLLLLLLVLLLLLLQSACSTAEPTGQHAVGMGQGSGGSPSATTNATGGSRHHARLGRGASRAPAMRRPQGQQVPVPRALRPASVAPARADARPAAGGLVASPPRPAEDPTNRVPPGDDTAALNRLGGRILDAVVRGDPAGARPLLFPRAPFLRLKAVAKPAAYHQKLWRQLRRDIRRLHHRCLDWRGVRLESLERVAPPVWVRPGQVYNRIGYYRTRYARLRYRLAGRRYTIFVHTLITWQGRWYLSHLLAPPRRRRAAPRSQ